VHLDVDVHVRPYRFTHGADVLDGALFHCGLDVRSPRSRHRVELEGVEAAIDYFGRRRGELLGRLRVPGPAVRVHLHPVPARPAQQTVNRCAKRLSSDVPQRLLDAADRTVKIHGTASRREVVEDPPKEVLDVLWVPADQVPRELVDVSFHLLVTVGLRVALTPAVNSLVGVDPYETEVLARRWSDQERRDVRYLHAPPSSSGYFTVVRPFERTGTATVESRWHSFG
jgi:hypothetical protein